MSDDSEISWPKVAAFVRQLAHDVRNQLNGLELEAALIAESVMTPDAMESLDRIREQLHHVAANLRNVSSKFSNPCPTLAPINATELFLIFQEQALAVEKLPEIDWSHSFEEEQINVDATELAAVAKELLTNARDFSSGGRVAVRGSAGKKEVIYQFHEPKSASLETKPWGRAPFQSSRRDGYGLGLWEARRLVEANCGKITHEYQAEAKQLLTTLSFPIL